MELELEPNIRSWSKKGTSIPLANPNPNTTFLTFETGPIWSTKAFFNNIIWFSNLILYKWYTEIHSSPSNLWFSPHRWKFKLVELTTEEHDTNNLLQGFRPIFTVVYSFLFTQSIVMGSAWFQSFSQAQICVVMILTTRVHFIEQTDLWQTAK